MSKSDNIKGSERGYVQGTAIERFEAYVDRNGPVPEKCPELGPCWLWTGYQKRGYGRISDRGKRPVVHRWSYERFRGPIPVGLELHHACEIKLCCNPWHVEAMTRKEHMRSHLSIGVVGAAIKRGQTHCKREHPFTGDNIYWHKGHRRCRTCRRAEDLEFKARCRAARLLSIHRD